jgi:hypothetical protein
MTRRSVYQDVLGLREQLAFEGECERIGRLTPRPTGGASALAQSAIGLSIAPRIVSNSSRQTRSARRSDGMNADPQQLKTKASEATVPLPPSVIKRLRANRESLGAERPDIKIDDGLVFVTSRGLAVNGSWLTKHFQALLEHAGLPRMLLHDLRHGAARLLVGAGVHPRIAQELLRHASSKMTMEIYSHVSAAQQREAVGVLQRAIAAESHAESRAKPDLDGPDLTKAAKSGRSERESGSGGPEPAVY